ncbi:unnamed protein product [Trichogramma brassicae]|uniref:Uncharacterized protein n=1 Tax=Trichogramma brassicae TaxID=86971 RepID=A0A6H5HXN1_9HYME|nr:unnamed protein product [Trichogramma brassicae]
MKFDEAKPFIEFVARSGYKVKPKVSKSGKQSSRRTTPLHHLCRRDCWIFSTDENIVANWLFDVYDGIDVNYIDKSGLTYFHVACKFGRTDVVKKFLDLGQDPNLVWPKTNYSSLHLAMQRQQRGVAELLLRAGADPNSVGEDGNTPLNFICYIHNYVDLAKMLFELSDEKYRVQVDHLDKYKNTPLHVALKYDETELARFLLEMGADLNLADGDDRNNGLHLVCKMGEGNDGLADMIFGNDDYKPLPIHARNHKGNTPLHLAMRSGALNMVEVLLRHGADSNATNKKGMTPLHILCKKYDDPTMLNLFLRVNDELGRPVLIDALDNNGETPLVWALNHGNLHSAEVLLRRGVDPRLGPPLNHICYYGDHWVELFFDIIDGRNQVVDINARDNEGDTPLIVAAEYGHRNSTELLLRRGGDPNLVNNVGMTALHRICEDYNVGDRAERFFAIIDEIGQRVLINAQNTEGNAPLHLALPRGYTDLVRLLLRRGSDPNLANAEGSTPLHVICKRDSDDDLAKLFFDINDEIDQRVLVDARDNLGNTPLLLALSQGHIDLVRLLLSRGSNPNLVDEEGSTPLHVICKREQDDGMVKMYFEINKELERLVQVDARDELFRTPLQLALTSLLPDAIDALLANGAALPSVFPPTVDDFRLRFNSEEYNKNYVKLRVASGILVVIDCLYIHRYEMDRTDALKIMKLFADFGLYEKSTNLEKYYWYDDKKFAGKSKETMTPLGGSRRTCVCACAYTYKSHTVFINCFFFSTACPAARRHRRCCFECDCIILYICITTLDHECVQQERKDRLICVRKYILAAHARNGGFHLNDDAARTVRVLTANATVSRFKNYACCTVCASGHAYTTTFSCVCCTLDNGMCDGDARGQRFKPAPCSPYLTSNLFERKYSYSTEVYSTVKIAHEQEPLHSTLNIVMNEYGKSITIDSAQARTKRMDITLYDDEATRRTARAVLLETQCSSPMRRRTDNQWSQLIAPGTRPICELRMRAAARGTFFKPRARSHRIVFIYVWAYMCVRTRCIKRALRSRRIDFAMSSLYTLCQTSHQRRIFSQYAAKVINYELQRAQFMKNNEFDYKVSLDARALARVAANRDHWALCARAQFVHTPTLNSAPPPISRPRVERRLVKKKKRKKSNCTRAAYRQPRPSYIINLRSNMCVIHVCAQQSTGRRASARSFRRVLESFDSRKNRQTNVVTLIYIVSFAIIRYYTRCYCNAFYNIQSSPRRISSHIKISAPYRIRTLEHANSASHGSNEHRACSNGRSIYMYRSVLAQQQIVAFRTAIGATRLADFRFGSAHTQRHSHRATSPICPLLHANLSAMVAFYMPLYGGV